jgi:hypothetical protein
LVAAKTNNEAVQWTDLRTRRTFARLALAVHVNGLVAGNCAPSSPEGAEILTCAVPARSESAWQQRCGASKETLSRKAQPSSLALSEAWLEAFELFKAQIKEPAHIATKDALNNEVTAVAGKDFMLYQAMIFARGS